MYACGLVLWEVASRCNLAEAPAAQPYRSVVEVKKKQKLLAFCLFTTCKCGTKKVG